MGFMRDLGGAIGYAAGRAKGAMNQAGIEAFEKENGRQIFFGGENTDPLLHKLIKEQPNNSWGQKFLDSDRAKRHVREQKQQQKQPGTATQLINRQRQRQEQAILNNQVAPGFASTQVKIKSPTQAEQIDAGMRPRSSFNTEKKMRYGDKDYRNAIALEDVQFVRERMDEPNFFGAIDLLNNNPGLRADGRMDEMRHNNSRIQEIAQNAARNDVQRLGPKPEGFVGEGMFGQVKELAPGYVEKTTPPVVEWPPRNADASNAGYLYDARDFKQEAEVQDYLSGAHIAPKVEAFNILPDGSTETISRDLRDNFEDASDRYTQLESTITGNSTPEEKAQAIAAKGILDVKRKQQEATAISKGIKLEDRHDGNVMVHKLTGNPIQLDFGMVREVSGEIKDYERALTTIEGMRTAGLSDEADIFEGVISDLLTRDDQGFVTGTSNPEALKDLAQQGASRLMKIKKVPDNYKTVNELTPSVRDSRMAGVFF